VAGRRGSVERTSRYGANGYGEVMEPSCLWRGAGRVLREEKQEGVSRVRVKSAAASGTDM
jgi:hypothetical protein